MEGRSFVERNGRPRMAAGGGAAGGLAERLLSLDGAPYPAYRSLRGEHRLGPLGVGILSVQPDPFAPPSRIRVTVPIEDTGLAAEGLSRPARIATEDFLARGIERWLRARPEVGGVVRCDPSAQQILFRTAVALSANEITLLLSAELPAQGRRILGRRAAAALADGIPRMVRETLARGSWDAAALERHRACAEDHAALTRLLAERGWVAFLSDGSRLARRSGELDAPLEQGNVALVAPPGLAAEVDLPHAGRVRGLAIPRGVTLLCGGGFHGKSTLLRALAAAVYPHVPGDGREGIATEPTAMGIRAEDGRAVHGVDLSPFIGALPDGRDAARFTTNNASGSTSQAAGIVEALEAGCRCLLIDEDTSATNFLLRDPWMARLLRPEQEPIVPLLSRLREIHDRFGTSTVLVVGGSGEAFRVADRVVLMDAYLPSDATARVAAIRAEMGPLAAAPPAAWRPGPRAIPIAPLREARARVRALAARRLLVAGSEIDLGASGALVHPSQARTLAAILEERLASAEGAATLPELAEETAARIAREGPGCCSRVPRGDLCEVRAQEIAMLFSRLRADASKAGTVPPPRG